jgi:5-formyltetrahydrofolate cyclo-ligase
VGLRHALSAGEVAHRSKQVFATFMKNVQEILPEPCRAAAIYHPVNGEVDTRPFFDFLKTRSIKVLFPKVEATGEPLRFYEVSDWSELRTGRHGIAEPQPRPSAAAETPDAVFVPGVAFSPACDRLGFGGGYYDRTSSAWEAAGARVRLIGLAYDFQVRDELAREPHDRPVDIVVSEGKIYRRNVG